ncbi:MAG: L,D-transpeptidase family protein [Cellulomonadaceae bacterium]|jgi:peptidoglycan hydrolase-like protein with peptidoglycan-binding domain|nr:L,D-transpeptidase family protein [Cellulomonadaceae bacterium]
MYRTSLQKHQASATTAERRGSHRLAAQSVAALSLSAALVLAGSTAANAADETSDTAVTTGGRHATVHPAEVKATMMASYHGITSEFDAALKHAAKVRAAEEKRAAKAERAFDASDRTLSAGMNGDDVLGLQYYLDSLNYFVPAKNGTFDSNTVQAVMALQKVAGIDRNGGVGKDTRKALKAGTVPTATTTLKGNAIEVDLANQILMAVDNGIVVKIFNISSGFGGTFAGSDGNTYHAVTNPGDFVITSQLNASHESTISSGGIMYRPKYFNGAIAIHGYTSVPAHAASHGCVRISYSGMDWLWDHWDAPIGTPVIAYN